MADKYNTDFNVSSIPGALNDCPWDSMQFVTGTIATTADGKKLMYVATDVDILTTANNAYVVVGKNPVAPGNTTQVNSAILSTGTAPAGAIKATILQPFTAATMGITQYGFVQIPLSTAIIP